MKRPSNIVEHYGGESVTLSVVDLGDGKYLGVTAHTKLHPTDEDWDGYMKSCGKWIYKYRVVACTVCSEGGTPSMFQLSKLPEYLPASETTEMVATFYSPNESSFSEFTVNNANRSMNYLGLTHCKDLNEVLRVTGIENTPEIVEAIEWPLKDLKERLQKRHKLSS